MDVNSAVTKLLAMSPSIRVATICDMNGKVTFSARRKSVKNMLSHKESQSSLRISAKNMKGRRTLSRKLGKCKYTLAEYDKEGIDYPHFEGQIKEGLYKSEGRRNTCKGCKLCKR